MKLEKGDIIKTDLSDNTVVLDIDNKQKQAVLFSGTQFVIASGIRINGKTGKFEWDNGRYANDIKTISDMKNNNFEAMKDTISFLAEYNHEDFVKSIISLETGVGNEDVLDNAYDNYMNDSAMGLVDDKFYNYIDDEELENTIGEKEKVNTKTEKDTEKDSHKTKKDTKTLNINGNIVGDIDVKELTSKEGNPFTVASFSVAENDEKGQVKFTNCLAYNGKIKEVQDFKKGDFVHIFGQQKKSIGKDGKEYLSLTVYSAKLLKAKEHTKVETKEKGKSSVMSKLNKYKEKSKEVSSKKQSPGKSVER